MNALDRAIAWIAPEAGARRAQARARSGAISRAVRMAYDGATRGRRAEGWRVVSTDANAEVQGSAARLRDVARDMVRNNPHASRAVQVIAHNVVGPGITPHIVSDVPQAVADLERLLKAHFDTTACDAEGRHDLYGLQNLGMKTVVQSGAVLCRMRPRRREDGLPLPFQLQMMEPDFLDTMHDGMEPNGNLSVQGVEVTPFGKIVAYWLFPEHPGSLSRFSFQPSRRVPAEFVAHVFRTDRPGQASGVSWLAPVVLRMRDFNDFADAQLVRQKIAACFAAFISGDPDVDPEETDDDPYPLETFQPGMIERVREGDTVSFGSPPQVAGYGEYMKASLHEIAAGLGISYEALTGDLQGVSFSSGRMGWLEFQRSIDAWRNHMLVPQLCHRIGAWFLDMAALELGRRYPASIIWAAPRREMIDPTKEVPAARAAIRAGVSSRSHEQRRLGFDPADLDAEIAADNARADALGLVLDSDPRRMSQSGVVQAAESDPPTDD